MKTLIYIEDVFEGSFVQFQNCFYSFGDDTEQFTRQEIEDDIASWCRQLDFNLLCVTEVSDEQCKNIGGEK